METTHVEPVVDEYPFARHRWEVSPDVQNCRKCGLGRSHWVWNGCVPTCWSCDGSPIIGDGRDDHDEWMRAKFSNRFGPRLPGDNENLIKYADELKRRSAF